MSLVLEKLDVGVEEITLGDVDILLAKLVDECEDPGGYCGFADGGNVCKWTEGSFVFKDDAIKFGNVELIGGGAGGDLEGEAVAG